MVVLFACNGSNNLPSWEARKGARILERFVTSMQRSEKEIKEREEIEPILEKSEIGRLGTCFEWEPYVVSLSFAYHDGKIVFHCARRGKKLDNIAKNPRVCFEVDAGDVISAENPCEFSCRYRSVIACGEARA